EALADPGVLEQVKPRSNRTRRRKSASISLEVYDRRISIYKTTIEFLRGVNAELKPDLHSVIKFGIDTDEALFLFDETISGYLSDIAKNAFRLRAASQTLDRGFTEAASQEQLALSMWFYEQFAEVRRRFAPFLQVAA